ncbi:MAG: Mov34/MPN/PAD-1 family protein [Infirmifilum sp.]
MRTSSSIIGPESPIRRVVISSHILKSFQVIEEERLAVLGGDIKDEETLVNEVKEIKGIYSAGTFRIDFREWYEAVQSFKIRGLKYIGILHSHSYGRPIPSPLDTLRMSECPGEVWIIVSPKGIRAWTYDSQLREIDLVIV